MNTERLLLLAGRMDKRAAEIERGSTKFSFDLNGWGTHEKGCGTVACAIGDATLMPAFRKMGLSNYKTQFPDSMIPLTPVYDGVGGWAAVKLFFDISADESESLFDARSYPRSDPALVAARIRAFVETGEVSHE